MHCGQMRGVCPSRQQECADGAFDRAGTSHRLRAGMRAWQHTGFSVDASVRIHQGDRAWPLPPECSTGTMPPTMASNPAQRTLLVLLIGSMLLVALVLRPMAEGLFLGAVFAAALLPLQRWVTRKLRRPRLSAALVITALVLLALVPLVTLSVVIVRETADATRYVRQTLRARGVDALIARLPDPIERTARTVFEQLGLGDEDPGLDVSAQEEATAVGGKAARMVGAAVSATGSFVFQTVMMLIALFFLLTHTEEITRWVDRASPLAPGETRALIDEFKRVSSSVLRSTVLTAAIQAAAALIGFLIAQVPHPLFFMGVTFFVAMIPAIGAASVCLATALLLALTGHPWAALFLAIWGLVIVGVVDNVVKPFLMRNDVGLHGAVVFFALIGGLGAFGPIGLILGPLAAAFLVATLRFYRRDYPEGGRAKQA